MNFGLTVKIIFNLDLLFWQICLSRHFVTNIFSGQRNIQIYLWSQSWMIICRNEYICLRFFKYLNELKYFNQWMNYSNIFKYLSHILLHWVSATYKNLMQPKSIPYLHWLSATKKLRQKLPKKQVAKKKKSWVVSAR